MTRTREAGSRAGSERERGFFLRGSLREWYTHTRCIYIRFCGPPFLRIQRERKIQHTRERSKDLWSKDTRTFPFSFPLAVSLFMSYKISGHPTADLWHSNVNSSVNKGTFRSPGFLVTWEWTIKN